MTNDAMKFTRRETLGLLMGALAAYPFMASRELWAATPGAANMTLQRPSMARAAAIHDALLLLATDNDVTGEWQDVMLPLPIGKPWEFSYAYGVASLDDGGQLLRDVVAEVRSGWAGREPAFMDLQRHKGGMLERHLIVALGWAANHGGAPLLFDGVDGDGAELAVDGVFMRALAGVESVDEAHARRLFQLLYERAMIAMHTIEPDLDGWGGLDIAAMHEIKDPKHADVNRFIDAYADWIEGIDERCTLLARAIASPAPAGLPTGKAFYDPADALIAKTSKLRRGMGTANEPGRWAAEAGDSRFALAVSKAYANVRLVLEAARGDRPAEDIEQLL